jgi:hypothetical protein
LAAEPAGLNYLFLSFFLFFIKSHHYAGAVFAREREKISHDPGSSASQNSREEIWGVKMELKIHNHTPSRLLMKQK